MYIWLFIAKYTHKCSLNAPERCSQHLHSAFTPKKLVCTTLSWHSYSVVLLNFYAKDCSSSPSTLPCSNTAE